jgi:hypothetical protein
MNADSESIWSKETSLSAVDGTPSSSICFEQRAREREKRVRREIFKKLRERVPLSRGSLGRD